jgi:C-terminal processing protease CtpA/Prc
MQDLWDLVERQPVQRLVVDLRGNGGGNSLQFERYFMPGLKKYPHLDDPERLFVLIDRGTFSSASDNAAQLRIDSRATFVGEPTGGSPNGYGEVRSFRLPNSEAQVFYSTRYFMNMDTDITSIEPDLLVEVPSRAVFSGRDPVLEQLLPQENWQTR